jgi:hypothetical protein
LDSVAQLTGDWWQLSPSVFTRSRAIGDTQVAAPPTFFRCPRCELTLTNETPDEIICSNCGKHWPIVDGIYDFRDKE